MATFEVREARTHLSRLLLDAERGRELVIARNGRPIARLVPLRPRGRRQFGALRGQVRVPDRFFDPLPESELERWEEEVGAAPAGHSRVAGVADE